MKESLYDLIVAFNILTDAAIFLLLIGLVWDLKFIRGSGSS